MTLRPQDGVISPGTCPYIILYGRKWIENYSAVCVVIYSYLCVHRVGWSNFVFTGSPAKSCSTLVLRATILIKTFGTGMYEKMSCEAQTMTSLEHCIRLQVFRSDDKFACNRLLVTLVGGFHLMVLAPSLYFRKIFFHGAVIFRGHFPIKKRS